MFEKEKDFKEFFLSFISQLPLQISFFLGADGSTCRSGMVLT